MSKIATKNQDVAAAEEAKKATRTIKVLVESNPKRPSGKSHARFELYKTGMTTEEYIAAVGDRSKATADLKWDEERKYIEVA